SARRPLSTATLTRISFVSPFYAFYGHPRFDTAQTVALNGSVRIVGGELGGRRLAAPKGARTRPTSDRVKEALFHILGAPPGGARVLDLFAGSGALGLEALSRGAAEAVFIESAESAERVLRANIAALGVTSRTRVIRGEALRIAARLGRQGARFAWIFI